MTLPPAPPSPPSGPPFGTYFSRRKLTEPEPPFPARTSIDARSANTANPALRSAQPADQSGAEVREDVAVEIGEHEHVVVLGRLDELHAHVVDDPVLEIEPGEFLRRLARGLEKEAVGELHDVGLVHGRDLPPLPL